MEVMRDLAFSTKTTYRMILVGLLAASSAAGSYFVTAGIMSGVVECFVLVMLSGAALVLY